MSKVDQIEKAIDNANNGISKITQEVLHYPGFTSHTNKHLFNNLGGLFDKYLECGVHKCSTFISTLYENKIKGIAIDNWSQFDEGGVSKKMAYEYCEKWLSPDQYKMIESDYYILQEYYTNGILKLDEVDMYFFDGEHSYESQKWGITHFVPKLKKGCLVIIDDASWPDVYNGTYDGIRELGLEFEYEKYLWDGQQEGKYWNGLFLFIFK